MADRDTKRGKDIPSITSSNPCSRLQTWVTDSSPRPCGTDSRASDRSHHRTSEQDGTRGHDGARAKKAEDKYRDASSGTTLVELQNLSLRDDGRRYAPFRLRVPRGIRVPDLERWVRPLCRGSDRVCGSISDSARLLFFANERELGDDDLADMHLHVYFLAVHDSNGAYKLTDLDDGDRPISGQLGSDMLRSIVGGDTIGQIRRLVARHKKIEDPNRIVIAAREGWRMGHLQGDMWQLCQVKRSYCHWLSVQVYPPRSYFRLGSQYWGNYVLHIPPRDFQPRGTMLAREVMLLMENQLLNHSSWIYDPDSETPLKWTDITLLWGGGALSDSTVLQYGARVGFELPGHLQDVLALRESWLLTATATCAICTDGKKPTEIPARITSACKHRGTTCRDCLDKWISLSLENWGIVGRVKCAECTESLEFEDVRRFASEETFALYDTLTTRGYLANVPNFKWCLSTTCESGQVVDVTCTKFTCHDCAASHCIKHSIPWHSGESCEEYDRRNKRRRKEDKKSEDTIRATSKQCPGCNLFVHKFSGCNHMTCRCGHDWCYICLAPYYKNDQGFLHCQHKSNCTEAYNTEAYNANGLIPPEIPYGVEAGLPEAWGRLGGNILGGCQDGQPHPHEPRWPARGVPFPAWHNRMAAPARARGANREAYRVPDVRPIRQQMAWQQTPQEAQAAPAAHFGELADAILAERRGNLAQFPPPPRRGPGGGQQRDESLEEDPVAYAGESPRYRPPHVPLYDYNNNFNDGNGNPPPGGLRGGRDPEHDFPDFMEEGWFNGVWMNGLANGGGSERSYRWNRDTVDDYARAWAIAQDGDTDMGGENTAVFARMARHQGLPRPPNVD